MAGDRKTPKVDALKELHRFVEQSLKRKLPRSVVNDIANAPGSSEINSQDPLKKNEKAAKKRQGDAEA